MEAGCKARFPYKTGNDGIRKCGEPELIGPIKSIGDNAQITFFAFVNFVNSANLTFEGDLLLYTTPQYIISFCYTPFRRIPSLKKTVPQALSFLRCPEKKGNCYAA